jgi:transcriptional regulator with XRE-family HTH domain
MKRREVNVGMKGGFAARLQALREASHMSQQDLADASGVHRVSLARLELGEQQPSWETVVKLADALGVSTEAFREGPEAEGAAEPPPARKAATKRPARKKRK